MKRNVWKLIARPDGINFEEALELVEEEISDPENGQIQIKLKILDSDMFHNPILVKEVPILALQNKLSKTEVSERVNFSIPDIFLMLAFCKKDSTDIGFVISPIVIVEPAPFTSLNISFNFPLAKPK